MSRPALLVVPLLIAACSRGASVGSTGGAPAAARLPAEVTPANIALGDSLFNTGGCMRCHGKAGIGATNAPALNDSQWLQLKTGSYDEIVGIITSGVPAAQIKDPTHKNPMGARGGRMALTDPQIKAVAAYVYSLSHK